ncbi:MAG: AI-2E family transporter [Actinobacteria bacterium]|nr:AI-2E family transporter [Actinomycetota bacterium]
MARFRPARRTRSSQTTPPSRTTPAGRTAPPGRAEPTGGRPPKPGDVTAAIPVQLQVAAGYAWRLIVVAIALWGLGQILAATTAVVIPLAVALLLTALLMPIAVLLNHRLNIPRHAASAITVLAFLAIVIGLLSLAGTRLVAGVTDLVDQAGLGIDRVTDWLQNGPLHIGGDKIAEYIQTGREWVSENSQTLSRGALRASGTATEFAAGTLIAMISTFFFLAEGDRIWAWLVRLMPEQAQSAIHEGFRRGFVSLGAYARTQCLVAAVDAVFITLGARALDLPLLIPMALIIFFASFIPIIGAFVSGALAVLVALVTQGPVAALIMLAVILAVQQIEGHVLQPVLMSKAVALHPLAVILGVGLGSFLLGIVGALFAVPFLAVVNATVSYWSGRDTFPGLARGMSAVGSSPKKLAGEQDGASVDDVEKEEQQRLRRIGSASPDALRRTHRREQVARES